MSITKESLNSLYIIWMYISVNIANLGFWICMVTLVPLKYNEYINKLIDKAIKDNRVSIGNKYKDDKIKHSKKEHNAFRNQRFKIISWYKYNVNGKYYTKKIVHNSNTSPDKITFYYKKCKPKKLILSKESNSCELRIYRICCAICLFICAWLILKAFPI